MYAIRNTWWTLRVWITHPRAEAVGEWTVCGTLAAVVLALVLA